MSVATPGNGTSYTYDSRNRVKSATADGGTTCFDYYPDGKKKSVSYPNGTKEEYEYFATNRVKTVTSSLSGTPFSAFAYSYDGNGNRLAQDETRESRAIGTSYQYDTLDRLVGYRVTENGGTTETAYTFDGYNRATETVIAPNGAATTKSYSYDETDWLTGIDEGIRQTAYRYDNNGNMVEKAESSDPEKTTLYAYDARDKLTSAIRGETTLGTYSYNADGFRIRQNGGDRGDVEYLYDGKAVIEERAGGSLLAHYRYAGRLYSLTDGTSTQYYHLDALGSTTELTDESGAIKAGYFLSPWGQIVESFGESVNRRIFTGKEEDKATGLVYFGQRYYGADTGRFISQDSYLGDQGTPPSLHRYLYAYSNPTVYVDLYGYESIFSDAADFLHGLSKGSKSYISNLNKKPDKGLGDRALAATMGIGNTLIEGVAGAADLADLTTDVTLAMNPATRRTEDGDKARRRVNETATNVTLTAQKVVEYVTTEDPAAMVQTAKEKLGNYLEKTFIEGDLNYTADFSGKAFGVALGGASVRAAQIGKAAEAAVAEGHGVVNTVDDAIRYERYWEELGTKPGSLNNRSARAWYLSKELEIPSMLDQSAPLEVQARQGFEFRNSIRSQARDLMANQNDANFLILTEPNLTWDELLAIKSTKHSGDELWRSIITSSQKSRAAVDAQFGFTGNR